MRTTKRFTPAVLDRFRRQNRGQGTHSDYIPWHRVSRGDPSSLGRSHLTWRQGRYYELLSDLEQIALFFALMTTTNNDDVREQLPLSLDPAFHEAGNYDCRSALDLLPGTQQIAERLDIRHPMTHGDGRSKPWVMSTDLLIVFLKPNQKQTLLAISVKTTAGSKKHRARQLAEIERVYWEDRNVDWLQITPEVYDPRVADLLFNTKPWALGAPVPQNAIKLATTTIYDLEGSSLTQILRSLSRRLGSLELAQRALWQSIWFGHAPVDLRRGWRPHLPLKILSRSEFLSLNPITSRRSAHVSNA